MLDALLPHVENDDHNADVQGYLQRAEEAEEARQLARVRTTDQHLVDAGRDNLRLRDADYHPGDLVWVWTPIGRRGLSEKLLRRYFVPYKIQRRVGQLVYEVVPDVDSGTSRRRTRPEVLHVIRLKPYYAR